MKVSKIIGERFRENPSDSNTISYSLLIRGGYIKQMSSGIFSNYYPLVRITQRIETILRKYMDKLDGQEVKLPVVMHADLWKKSERYYSIGEELVRFKDRNNTDMVLGMTHEEAAVHLVKDFGKNPNVYPFMIYQIQTKFRDEARPRAGLIRVKEFCMKDAYSFHLTEENLNEYYYKCLDVYNQIFDEVGLSDVICVESDSGMMGGKVSHEFMYLTDIGEDTIAICSECDYKSNVETAPCNYVKNISSEKQEKLVKISTPNLRSIDDLHNVLGCSERKICKAVVYSRTSSDKYIIIFIRGDMTVNETKLRNLLKEDIVPANLDCSNDLTAGFIGPVGLDTDKFEIYYDKSLEYEQNLVCGANSIDEHYIGFNINRDVNEVNFIDVAKINEDCLCPKCNKNSIKLKNGIEVGNIFQLGNKYTEKMDMTTTIGQKSFNPIMGCYGIGVGRLVASICEEHHDEHGPIWPLTISPWDLQLCCLRSDINEVKEFAYNLYSELQSYDYDILYDDREIRAGQMFSDADLLGMKIRIIVSPKTVEQNSVEILIREENTRLIVNRNDILETLKKLTNE